MPYGCIALAKNANHEQEPALNPETVMPLTHRQPTLPFSSTIQSTVNGLQQGCHTPDPGTWDQVEVVCNPQSPNLAGQIGAESQNLISAGRGNAQLLELNSGRLTQHEAPGPDTGRQDSIHPIDKPQTPRLDH